jgi:hypothetical protein
MALTATRALDIRAFETGLSRATGALDGFAQKTVKNTNRDLSRMLEEFTGQRVVAESARMVEAVERIGGASKLTEAEQRKVNATVSEAIAKYHALGQEAPAALKSLQSATSGAVEKTSLLSTGMKTLVGLFSLRAIANAAGDVLEFTGKLTDLSAKTGVGTEALQRLNYVTAQSGVTLETVADGVVRLGKNLVGGNDSAVKGVEALGLSVGDLIKMSPDAAFMRIGEAIATVPNPMEQAALATAIFGKAGADYLPAFTSDMSALAKQAQDSGAILSDDLVKGGDDAGDALTRLQGVGLTLLGKVPLPMAPAIETLGNLAGQYLPSAFTAAQRGVESLIEKGMRLEVWLLSTAEAIARTVSDVPIMGQVFGSTSNDVAELAARAQHARDTLSIFTAEGAQPATAAATAAAPMMTNFSASLDRVAASSQRAAVGLGKMQGPAADLMNLESRTLQETGKLTQALESGARINGAVLAPSIRQVNLGLGEQSPLVSTAMAQWVRFAPTVQQNTAAAATSSSGFMDKLKGLFGGGGGDGGSKLGQILGAVGPQFAAAFMGPGSAGDKMKAFATQAASTLMGMIPVVGPWLSAFSGPIIAGLSKLAAKAKSILRSIFGGPSSGELEGRAEVAAFEEQLWGTLTAAQELEAGGEAWKKTVIALTAAYVKAGKTEEEALAAAEKLWKSSKQGAEASRQAIEEINAVINALPENKTIEIETNYTGGEPSGGVIGGPPGVSRPDGGSGSSSGGGGGDVIVRLELDGRQIAEAIVPHLPDALRRSGAASATWP